MPKLIIDNREVEVHSGATVLDAAEKLGITIPTMCFLKGYEPLTSCMVCIVKIEGSDGFVPACGSIAQDGMRVCSSSEEVRQARKAALELLLSDHLGDCMGPCQVTCPAGMNIPLMIRQIAAARLHDAIVTVKRDIALPAVLGRICPAPCEKACRRAAFDEPVSICLLKRYVADVDLQSPTPYLPACKPSRHGRVAIIGAGPAGLAAAYYLRQDGFDCTIFDEHDEPGGMLRYAVSPERLPRDVLASEIASIMRLGVEFRGRTRIGDRLSTNEVRKQFDVVFVAVGELKPGDAESLGLEAGSEGLNVDGKTYATNVQGVFAGGDAVRKRRLAVRAVADGKEAAVAICQYSTGQRVTGPSKAFNTRIGKLVEGEIDAFVARASRSARVQPSKNGAGLTDEQGRSEAARCLHCDCRKAESCKLRQYGQEYEARPNRYKNQKTERRPAWSVVGHPSSVVRYEPGKCIKCGLCIKIAAQVGEKLGLTFVGRGFDVRVAVPFDGQLSEALKTAARQCVAACPTGALAFKD
jgi:ferredoxin